MQERNGMLDTAKQLWRSGWTNFRLHHPFQAAAALSYYALFSLAPLVIVVVAVAGLFFSDAEVQAALVSRIRTMANEQAAMLVETIIENTTNEERNVFSLIVAGTIIALGATTAFAQLYAVLNRVWNVPVRRRRAVWNYLKGRLISFLFLIVIGTLLAASLVFNTFVAALGAYLSRTLGMNPAIWDWLDLATSYGVTTVLIATIYKYVPNARVKWRDAALGAIVASLLFESSKSLVRYYIAQTSPESSFGAAGSVVVFLLWIYVASLIMLIGAEVSRTFAAHRAENSEVPASDGDRLRGV